MLVKILEKIRVLFSSNGPTDPESVRPAENATFSSSDRNRFHINVTFKISSAETEPAADTGNEAENQIRLNQTSVCKNTISGLTRVFCPQMFQMFLQLCRQNNKQLSSDGQAVV